MPLNGVTQLTKYTHGAVSVYACTVRFLLLSIFNKTTSSFGKYPYGSQIEGCNVTVPNRTFVP